MRKRVVDFHSSKVQTRLKHDERDLLLTDLLVSEINSYYEMIMANKIIWPFLVLITENITEQFSPLITFSG